MSDDHPLIEEFNKLNLFTKRGVNPDAVSRMGLKEIRELSEKILELTSLDKKDFLGRLRGEEHCTTISLSGGTSPCHLMECRTKKVNDLLQFTSIFSDRVYVQNLFLRFINPHSDFKDEAEVKEAFCDDVMIFWQLKPFIAENIIVPVSPPNICQDCLAKQSFGKDADLRYKRVHSYFEERFVSETKVSLERESHRNLVNVSGPEDLLNHGFSAYELSDNELKRSSMGIWNRLQKGPGKLELSKEEKKELLVGRFFLRDLAVDMRFEMAAAHFTGAHFLTDHQIGIDFLNKFTNDIEIERRNLWLSKHLTCILPFIGDISSQDLIRLRKNEADITLFRNEFYSMINTFLKNGSITSERHARDLYLDVIRPRLAKIDRQISNAKRTLVKDVRREIVGLVGAVAFGTYTGFLPSSLIQIATALGTTKILADLLKNVMNKTDNDETCKNDPMYFLWEIKKLGRKL